MSDSSATNSLSSVDQGASHEDRTDVGAAEVFRWIYRFFYSKTVGLILILLLAFYAVIGSVIVQASPGTFSNPAAKEAFMAQVGTNYGPFAGILSALGFFHAFTSVGFYVVVAMLALSVAACTIHRIPELIKRQNSPRVHVSNRFFDKARYRGEIVAVAPSNDAMTAVRRVLEENRFRVLDDPRDPSGSAYGDRFAWSGIGTVLAHLSFIIILAAFVVSATWGIEDLKTIPVGGSVAVGHGTDWTLTADSFQDTYTDEGRPADYVSELELSGPEGVLKEQEVRVNAPLTYKGWRFHQQTFGVAAEFIIAGPEGDVLFDGAIPLQWTSNDGLNAVGRIELPQEDLEVIVATAASGQTASRIPVGAAAVEVYGLTSGDPVDMGEVSQGDTEDIAGLGVTFERETKYTGVLVRHDPGTIWMWIGSALLIVGMCITFIFQYRRIWARVFPMDVDSAPVNGVPVDSAPVDSAPVDGPIAIRFGAVARWDASYQRLFENVVAEVSQTLSTELDQPNRVDAVAPGLKEQD